MSRVVCLLNSYSTCSSYVIMIFTTSFQNVKLTGSNSCWQLICSASLLTGAYKYMSSVWSRSLQIRNPFLLPYLSGATFSFFFEITKNGSKSHKIPRSFIIKQNTALQIRWINLAPLFGDFRELYIDVFLI